MIDPVAVALNNEVGRVVEREYAEIFDLEILDDEPLYERGRIRGVFRLDGRPVKPKAAKGRRLSIPTTTDTGSEPAAGNDDGVAVENTKE